MHSNLINTRLVLTSAALAVIASLSATAPASAASRVLLLQDATFQDRCVNRAGALEASGAAMTCTIEATAVACQFQQNTARCSWAGGIYNKAALALLGWPDSAISYDTTGSVGVQGGNGGGGVDAPDLPLDNGGGGGGIDLPDLPLDNGGGGGGFDKPDFPINNT